MKREGAGKAPSYYLETEVKLLVQTNGAYVLYDMNGRQTVAAFRPSVVTRTAFIDLQRGSKLTVLEELADEATDATLAAATNEEELKAAIEALPRAKAEVKVTPTQDPLDHDNDGRKGGSLPKAKRTK